MSEVENMTENHRFRIAIVFIVGSIAILMVALVGEILGSYQGVANLAGILSGWLTAVIGFYFLGQSEAQARQRSREATMEAAKAKEEKSSAEEEKMRIIHKGKPNIEELQDIIQGYKALIEELIAKLDEMEKRDTGIERKRKT
jgi:uncharacterized protein HemX